MWLFQRILKTDAPAAVLLVRLLVGIVFLSEGVQKFLYPELLGVGRFIKIGLPHPEILAPMVACFEIGCGSLVALGLLTRLAAVPLVVIISVAIWTTKIPMLAKVGFWAMAHEARADYCMLLGGIFLLIVGGGMWSIDRCLFGRSPQLGK